MNTVQLNFKQTGEGPAIVILHGLFGSLDNWQTMARELADQGFSVYTVDLRNHGKSPHTDDMSHELMAEDVKEFIEQHDLQGCTLVGHSMGGKTAMQLAMQHPELISKLVVVDIAPKPYMAHHNIYFDALLNLDVKDIESRSDANKKLGKTVKNEAVKLFLLKNLDRTKDGYNWKFNLKALDENYKALINGLTTSKQFTKPTLFIAGQLSDYITKGDAPEIEKLFPNSKIEFIAKSGHWVHAEQPEQFQSVLLDFIKAN